MDEDIKNNEDIEDERSEDVDSRSWKYNEDGDNNESIEAGEDIELSKASLLQLLFLCAWMRFQDFEVSRFYNMR